MEHLLQIDFQTSLAYGVKVHKMLAKFYSQIICLYLSSEDLHLKQNTFDFSSQTASQFNTLIGWNLTAVH